LIKEDAPYSDLEPLIKRKIDRSDEYFERFTTWFFTSSNKENIENARVALLCISHLLVYEVNNAFEKWYNKKFVARKAIPEEILNLLRCEKLFIRGGEKRKLEQAHEDYYKHLFKEKLLERIRK
jgi:hypothetical protein